MAQYVTAYPGYAHWLILLTIDSAKWRQYAPNHRWPLSWLYRREGDRLLAYERSVAAQVERSFFVTENETELFCQSAPECRDRVEPMCNGVDAVAYTPDRALSLQRWRLAAGVYRRHGLLARTS